MGICAWKETAYIVLSQDLGMGASLVAQLVKNLPAVCETQIQFLDQEDPLEKEMATHSSILENSGGLQSIGSQRVGPDWVSNFLNFGSWGHISEVLHHCLGTNRALRPFGPIDYLKMFINYKALDDREVIYSTVPGRISVRTGGTEWAHDGISYDKNCKIPYLQATKKRLLQ